MSIRTTFLHSQHRLSMIITRPISIIQSRSYVSNSQPNDNGTKSIVDSHYISLEKMKAEQTKRRERQSQYSEFTKKIIWAMARLMGYNTSTSTAIRVTSDIYDQCAIQAEMNPEFWLIECDQPDTYQTWFNVTKLHVWMIIVRIRMEDTMGRKYLQEIIDNFFIDAELRMREKYGVTSGRLVTEYLKDLWSQFNASQAAFDEGLVSSDVVLASALYRNLFALKLRPVPLAKVVEYVRKQVQYLDSLPSEEFLKGNGIIFAQPKIDLVSSSVA